MPQKNVLTFLAMLCTCAPALSSARAADDFYLGSWKVTDSAAAPWAPTYQPQNAEARKLLGKAVTFKKKQISGPQPFACKGPAYTVKDVAADALFQGAFEEMRRKNASTDPNKIAVSLGFSTPNVKTLETGCQIDFHFVDLTTAKAALNDRIYTLKKR